MHSGALVSNWIYFQNISSGNIHKIVLE